MSGAILALYGSPARTPAGGRAAADLLDNTLFLPGIWLCCSLSVSLRLIGPAFVIIPTGSCILYGLLRKAVPPRMLTAFLGYCLLSAILSWFQLFPTSWQVHFMREAIFRQLIPPIGVFAAAWASKAYFRLRLAHGGVFSGARLITILSTVVAPAVLVQQHVGYEGDYSVFAVIALCGAFINNMLIALFFVAGAVFLSDGWRRYMALALVLFIAATSHFVQFKLLTLIVVAALVGMSGRMVAAAAIAMLVSIYAVGLNYVPEMMLKDPNDGLRLAFVSDTITSVADTFGMGVGYGKESVHWNYNFPGMPVFTFLPDPNTMTRARMLEALSTGVHNSFAEALLRTGIPGCALLIAAMVVAFPPATLPRGVRNHAAVMFAMIFIACFVNPALESPIQVVGVGFVYGYLLALRAAARSGGHGVSAAAFRWG